MRNKLENHLYTIDALIPEVEWLALVRNVFIKRFLDHLFDRAMSCRVTQLLHVSRNAGEGELGIRPYLSNSDEDLALGCT